MSGSGVNMARSLGRGRQLSFDGKARKITLSRLNWENWDGRRGRKGGGRGGRARRGRGGRHEAEREERREGRRTDGRRGGHHKFCPNFRIRFRSERGLSLSPPRQGRTSNLLQLFRQYSFAALHWVFHALVRHSRVPTTKRRELQSAKWLIGAGRAALQGEENGLHLGQNFLAEQRFAAVRYRYVFLAKSGSGCGRGPSRSAYLPSLVLVLVIAAPLSFLVLQRSFLSAVERLVNECSRGRNS